ncbi:MAG: alpha/beta hydrolase fold domain-containing protein [Clostridia bacterium]|nr:alpha/beta hydrolase fold domain-containing protein [Clostridia bacterium]
MPKLSVQLWSLKDVISDFKGTIEAVAKAGYDGIEFCGDSTFYGNMEAGELKAYLNSLGLVSSGAHVGYAMLRDNLDEVIAYHKTLGSRYIIVPAPNREYDLNERSSWEKMNADMLVWNKKIRENGMVLGWHNHADEFIKFGDEYAYDIVLSGDNSMIYEVDTYWSEYAGVDTCEYLKSILRRTPLIHLKDMQILPDGKKESEVYGEGILDNEKILFRSIANNAEWLVIEWEDFEKDAIPAITKSAENLKKMLHPLKKTINLWDNVPGLCEEVPLLSIYVPDEKKSDAAIVIFTGGGYHNRAPHEGDGYARYLAGLGITAFVCDYRVSPHRFPLPLLDARRAIRTVRSMAEEYGLDKNKIGVMGSSAGGHLAALVSTYFEPIEFEGVDEIDNEDFIPNAQILCYPVIKLLDPVNTHIGSGKNLLAEKHAELGWDLSPDRIVSERTPKAFIWHTFTDQGVSVVNSLDYAKALRALQIPAEMHIFPVGGHGLGLADGDPKYGRDTQNDYIARWSGMLEEWLKLNGWLNA